MKYTCRKVKGSLFSQSDTSNGLRDYYANGTPDVEVEIPEGMLRHISEKIGINIKYTAAEIKDFVSGTFPAGTNRPGDSVLAHFGEILSYLEASANGQKPQRIVSYKKDSAAPEQNTFPQPDYYISLNGLPGALEVKTTSALDFKELSDLLDDSVHHTKQLSPCTSAKGRRLEALEQLGYVPNTLTHSLGLIDGRFVDFPAAHGIAHIHLLNDGRVFDLRSKPNVNSRIKTPSYCRKHSRNCWDCIHPSERKQHLASFELSNNPGRLSLVGSGREETWSAWRVCHREWYLAVWARDSRRVYNAEAKLLHATARWAEDIADSLDLGPGSKETFVGLVLGRWVTKFRRGFDSRHTNTEVSVADLPTEGTLPASFLLILEDGSRVSIDAESLSVKHAPDANADRKLEPSVASKPIMTALWHLGFEPYTSPWTEAFASYDGRRVAFGWTTQARRFRRRSKFRIEHQLWEWWWRPFFRFGVLDDGRTYAK